MGKRWYILAHLILYPLTMNVCFITITMVTDLTYINNKYFFIPFKLRMNNTGQFRKQPP